MIDYIIHNSLQPFPLKKNTVNTCITSPPYYDLRSYEGKADTIGGEECVEDYIEHILEVSRNVWDVLRDDGSYFLNIGDKYVNKGLQLVPYRVAATLIQDGWILRNTIAWCKGNSMPLAVKDRLKSAYEPVFHFVKKEKYFYNLDAIRMPHQTITLGNLKDSEMAKQKIGSDTVISKLEGLFDEFEEDTNVKGYASSKLHGQENKNIGARGGFAKNGETTENRYADGGKNPGDVFIEHYEHKWEFDCACGKKNYFDLNDVFIEEPSDTWFINIEPTKISHTATFPKKLVEKMILATTKPGDLVLDPFSGSGTTNIVAESLSRNSIGFDLGYSEAREQRLSENIEIGILGI